MKQMEQMVLTGERALFQGKDMEVYDSVFEDGESPLKESRNIKLYTCLFRWKYPLWYSEDIYMKNCTLFEMARAGIWYTRHVTAEDSIIEAPKSFRRTGDIVLRRVNMPDAAETLWNCYKVVMEHVTARGDYFAMNCTDMEIDDLTLVGNYSFDGCKNVVIRNSKLLSRDAFWNCENVTVYDSFISGEYMGWNGKNITLVNCTVESLQGMCYMENLVMKNCRLINTTLAFEYSSIDVECSTVIDSVCNPR